MKYFYFPFIFFFSFQALSFESNITQEQRDQIKDYGEILYGVFPSDIEKKFEENGLNIQQKSYNKSEKFHGFMGKKGSSQLYVVFKACEIEHMPTYCAGAKVQIINDHSKLEDKFQEVKDSFWRFDFRKKEEQIIASTILSFSDTTEQQIQYHIENLFHLLSLMEPE